MRIFAVALLMVLASGQAPAGQAPVLREAVAEPAVAQLVVPTLAGVWAYSNPNAKKVDGVHQWVSARAEMTQQGDLVQGKYECTYAVQEGEKLNPKVSFNFEGRLVSEVVVFEIKPPLKGTFKILKTSAAELAVSYSIQKAAKSGISFGEIPDNAPQPLYRQAQ
ncbi:hypothetical protein [uncultured Paludibaculum sp.]|uniref:hypothetical protein n=1 Tax=uncultured Paludibaculum sp. TaxID=1765020 RepID=UPI002AAB6479|nr:hypothetical protein [uncultured Paludibaculum sp.]